MGGYFTQKPWTQQGGLAKKWNPGAEVQSFTNKKEAQAYMKSMHKSTNTKITFIQAENCTCQDETSQEESGHTQTDNMAPDAEPNEE